MRVALVPDAVPHASHLLRFVGLLGMFLLAACAGTSNVDRRPSVATSPTQPAAATPARTLPPAPGANPRNAYVLLSGGGTPLSNNYSQYVQARAVAEYFAREFATEPTWTFFGIGNRDGTAPILADVRREVVRDGVVVQTWLPGSLPNNRPATKDSVLRALREEILPTIRGGGTLFLFVGDHGEVVGKDEQRESAITLWQLKRGRRRSSPWYTDDKEVLGVAELRRALAEGMGQGRVVFCMTQCHSGGFHELGVARAPVPPADWFVALPPSLSGAPTTHRSLPIAGFTATDQESPAAGCVADPDPDRWAGYERYLPESLLGIDLLSGRPVRAAVPSFAAAHEAATLVDRTIDKPRATSEHFLDTWAQFIETRLMTGAALLNPRIEPAVAEYRQAVNTGRVTSTDAALRERQARFERFTFQLAADVPAAKDLLISGTRAQLDAALGGRGERRGARTGRRGTLTELRRTWTETLRPAWKAAVLGGRVPGLSGPAHEFEKHMLGLEDEGRDFLLPRGGNDTPLLNELYWQSGYAEPATMNEPKAAAVVRWGAERRARIVAWGRASADAAVRTAAEKIGPGTAAEPEANRPMTRATAVERVVFYRRVLAAWEFLLRVQAAPQLAELHALAELERTPLRHVQR